MSSSAPKQGRRKNAARSKAVASPTQANGAASPQTPAPVSVRAEHKAEAETRGKRLRKRTLVFTGSVFSAAVIAVAAAYATHVFGPTADTPTAKPTISVAYGTGDTHYCGFGLNWVYPKAVNNMPLIPDMKTDQDWANWSTAQGGEPADGTVIQLVIQSPTDHDIVLTGMDAIVLARRPAISGTYIGAGGCGGINPVFFSVGTLDSDPVKVTSQPGQDAAGHEIPAVSFPFTLSKSEPDVFDIVPSASVSDVDWELVLHWVADGKPDQTVIDDHGKPFHFTGESNAVPAEYLPGTGWTAER